MASSSLNQETWKILLAFLLPAILSLNSASTNQGPEGSLPWLRYWVVLSVALLLEYCLERLEGKLLAIIKLVLLLWCLAPIDSYNGSDLLFNFVLMITSNIMNQNIVQTVKSDKIVDKDNFWQIQTSKYFTF